MNSTYKVTSPKNEKTQAVDFFSDANKASTDVNKAKIYPEKDKTSYDSSAHPSASFNSGGANTPISVNNAKEATKYLNDLPTKNEIT